MFRYIFSALFFSIFLTCSDIPRDNLLDPKNPDGFTESVVLVEAFVNTSDNIPSNYSDWAIIGLNDAADFIGEQVLVAEYHRDVQSFDDTLNSEQTSTRFSQLHRQYTIGQDTMGVPDIFVNGAGNRIRGSSGSDITELQVRDAITPFISEKNYFRIEAETQLSGNLVNVSCKIASLGNKSANGLNLRVIFLKDFGSNMRHVVLDLINVVPVADIEQGGVLEKDFDPVQLSSMPDRVIIAILNTDANQVLQAHVEDI